MSNRLVLGSYVMSQEWDRPSADTVAPGLEAAGEIIDAEAPPPPPPPPPPFNKRESSITCMCDLYPTLLRVLVVGSAEESFIPFPVYLQG